MRNLAPARNGYARWKGPHRIGGCSARCRVTLDSHTLRTPGQPHSRTVLSALAVASSRPSGLNATPQHRAGVAGQGAQVLAGGRVPQPHRLVVAGGGQQPPVRAERHRPAPRRCGRSRVRRRLAGGRVPQPHRLVVAGGGQQPPVRAERHRRTPRRCGRSGCAGGSPVAGSHSRTVSSLAGGGQQPPVRAERHRRTPRRCGRSGCARCSPVAGSHSRTVLSSLAVASSRPSGLNATPLDRVGVAGQGAPAAGRWPGPTAAPSCRRWRWPAAARPG